MPTYKRTEGVLDRPLNTWAVLLHCCLNPKSFGYSDPKYLNAGW